MSTLSPDRLRARLDGLARTIEGAGEAADEVVRIGVGGGDLGALIEALRAEDDGRRLELVDLTVVDRRPGDPPRLEVVYRLESDEPRARLRIHAELDAEDGDGAAPPRVESVTAVWPVAGWLEREAAELFGVEFRGHPDPGALLLGATPGEAPPSPPLARAGGTPPHVIDGAGA